MQQTRTFLASAARNPSRVGAIAPSSTALATELAGIVPRTGRPTIVELGPGTGVVSAAVQRALPFGGRHVAVEIDHRLTAYLQDTLPEVEVVHGDARDLKEILIDRGVLQVDGVVSGLPWALFDEDVQRDILREIRTTLTPGSAFTTFAYVHALRMSGALRFRDLLDETFGSVSLSRIVWRNLPPALCYVCR